ncbi:Hypothetical predicted protein [Cloeon dipterum]|uniref:Kinetochore protein SPC25 n=1 Tax=Cloeon dipterum TaxID=197152 RepID=A0A8S1CZ77_9INSE|nr:Hypothetical predicted protein [Cloeon dipterum]
MRQIIQAEENAYNFSDSIQQALATLSSQLNEKNVQLEETVSAIQDAKRRRKILTERLKEASLEDRRALENKLCAVEEVRNDLEKEKQALVMHFEDKKMCIKNRNVIDQIDALRVPKSLFSHYLQLSISTTEHNHKVLLKFPYRDGQQSLQIIFDTEKRIVCEPQTEILKFSKELNEEALILVYLGLLLVLFNNSYVNR